MSVAIPEPRRAPDPSPPDGICRTPGCRNYTPRGHTGEAASGWAPHCDLCARELDYAILRRKTPCPCDGTMHTPGGPLCQRRVTT